MERSRWPACSDMKNGCLLARGEGGSGESVYPGGIVVPMIGDMEDRCARLGLSVELDGGKPTLPKPDLLPDAIALIELLGAFKSVG